MDPLTIAAAIAATKTLVKSARGVQEIVHGIDGVFHAQDEHEKNKSHKPGSSIGEKNKSILQNRAKDDGGDDSISSAAAAVIEKKQLDQQIADLRDEIASGPAPLEKKAPGIKFWLNAKSASQIRKNAHGKRRY